MPRWPGPRKYDPLGAYLAQQHAETVTLTLEAIEAILGAPLPPTARASAFWSNYARTPPARVWRQAGWRVVRQQRRGPVEAVTFARAASEPLPPARRSRRQPRTLLPKYRPLRDFLCGVMADQIMLTVCEIEQIIGQPLPRSAWARGWWVNTSKDRHALAWLLAGWRVGDCGFDEGTAAVTFVRRRDDAPGTPGAARRAGLLENGRQCCCGDPPNVD